MIFKSIYLKEGLLERRIEFSKYVNLIHSEKNSCGKTTLLRFILYALGYNVPNTKKIKFNNCEVVLEIECERLGVILLNRYSENVLEAVISDKKNTFVLPEQKNALHKIIFGTENIDLLDNLLGAFYVDQEKGWTLLNRGIVIGSIHFSIEELIRGLAGCDCSDLIRKESQIKKELTKYKQMFSVAKYKEQLDLESENLVVDSYIDKTDIAISQLEIKRKQLKAEIRRIDRTLSDNKRFKKFVADMKLLVKAPDKSIFAVTEKNIVGMDDIIDLLVTKRKLVSAELTKITNKLNHLEKSKDNECEQLAFYETTNQLEAFDQKLAQIHINPIAIKQEIGRLNKERKSIQERITNITKNNNEVVSALSDDIIKYAEELGLGNRETIPTTYLFTSNLKELSGAVLHKTAFAFRLAYINAIEKVLNIKLPIILDSPSGKEVDQSNIKLMMDILKRDFYDHQIIIASIFKYDFDEVNYIEIRERLIQSFTIV